MKAQTEKTDQPDPSIEELPVEQLEALLRARRGQEHVRVIEQVLTEEAERLRRSRRQPESLLEAGVPLAERGPRGAWRRLPPERMEFNAVEVTPLGKDRGLVARLTGVVDRLLGRG
jgi:hypothetical protein